MRIYKILSSINRDGLERLVNISLNSVKLEMNNLHNIKITKFNRTRKYRILETEYSNSNKGKLNKQVLELYARQRLGDTTYFILKNANGHWSVRANPDGSISLKNNWLKQVIYSQEFGYFVKIDWSNKSDGIYVLDVEIIKEGEINEIIR
jgi:hypothetical protein